MPRIPRISLPGCTHHVMARCLDGIKIFGNDEDRLFFLELLGYYLKKTGFKCYAWCLLSDHFHLAIRTTQEPLSLLMKPLNGRFARYFNKRYSRRGYLFQDRFKSIATQDQNYVEEMVRYIHLNPIRAGLCSTITELEKYPWSGHGALTGAQRVSFQEVGDVLRRFGKNRRIAIEKYKEFINAHIQKPDELNTAEIQSFSFNSSSDKSIKWVIGDSDFIKRAMKKSGERDVLKASLKARNISLNDLAQAACKKCGIGLEEIYLRDRGGKRSEARRIFSYFAHRKCFFTVTQIAHFLGQTQPSVSLMIKRAEACLEGKLESYNLIKL